MKRGLIHICCWPVLGDPPYPTKDQVTSRLKSLKEQHACLLCHNAKSGNNRKEIDNLLSGVFCSSLEGDHNPLEFVCLWD